MNRLDPNFGSGRTYAWSYDALYRLTDEMISGASPTGSISYRYDDVGNRTNRNSSVQSVSSVDYSYNSNDRLTADGYNNNGDTTASGGNTYQYDFENRLTNAVVNSANIAVIYDGDGNRVRKTVGGVTTLYLVDKRNPSGYAQVLEELTISGSTTNLARTYTYGMHLISQRASDGTVRFYGYDGHGSTRFLTDGSGNVMDTYMYDAYGTLIASTGTSTNNYLFCGEQNDPDLKLSYNRERLLNTSTGRFLTMDTWEGYSEDPPSLHKYTYVQNDSVNRVDPKGLWPCKYFLYVHQQAIEDMLGLPEHDLEVLKGADAHMDDKQFQSSYYSFIHAMSSPVHTLDEARHMANNWVHAELTLARSLEAAGKHDLALEHLGQAMHTLQDSTSPSHTGFQYWDESWGWFSKPVREHIAKEDFNPGFGSDLYAITYKAYIYFKTSRTFPADFFPPQPPPLISASDFLPYVNVGGGVEAVDMDACFL